MCVSVALRVIIARSLSTCEGICNALEDCAVFRLHFTDLHCHTMAGPITHDEFLSSLVQYTSETSCIRIHDGHGVT